MSLLEVIKYGGQNDVFAWKYPNEELGTWSQLVVGETQEAVLLKDGQLCDLFTPGRYTMDTKNIPLLRNLVNLPFGGESPFAAEVWFINKAYVLDIKWGTPSPIQIQDPKYKIIVQLRSYGQFGIRVYDSKKFLLKLVGTLKNFDSEAMSSYFKGLYLTKVKDCISSYLVIKGISIVEINAYLEEMSYYLSEQMAKEFSEYGIELTSFFVNDVSFPEDDPGVARLKEALAKRAEMDVIGYSYEQERTFDTLESAAKNEGSGNMMGAGMGLGMGLGAGTGFGEVFKNMTQEMNTKEEVKEEPVSVTKECPKCHHKMSVADRYCSICGCDTEAKDEKDVCPHCGAVIKKGSKFCHECGANLMHKHCSKCGHELEDGIKFCPECGTKVE